MLSQKSNKKLSKKVKYDVAIVILGGALSVLLLMMPKITPDTLFKSHAWNITAMVLALALWILVGLSDRNDSNSSEGKRCTCSRKSQNIRSKAMKRLTHPFKARKAKNTNEQSKNTLKTINVVSLLCYMYHNLRYYAVLVYLVARYCISMLCLPVICFVLALNSVLHPKFKKIAKETAIFLAMSSVPLFIVYCFVMANLDYFSSLLTPMQIDGILKGFLALAVISLLWGFSEIIVNRIIDKFRSFRSSRKTLSPSQQ